MEMPRCTAVLATADEALQRNLPGWLASFGVELLELSADGLRAWEAVNRRAPELLIADAQLPRLDGAALARRCLTSAQLERLPRVLLFRRGFPLPQERELARLGALVLEGSPTGEKLREALNQLRSPDACFPTEQLRRVEQLLDALGVPRHPGRECLKYAALYCAREPFALRELGRRVYPFAGERAGLTPAQAVRAMRYSIDQAWRSDKFENQNRIFGNAVDAARGQPTCGEMISRLADILRTEG